MDDRRFDLLAKTVSAAPSRRGLLAGLLTALGLAGADAAGAKPGGEGKGTGKGKGGRGGKDHGRNRGNGHGNGRNRKGKRCDPKPDAEVCAGKCGVLKNNCGRRVQCTDCTCGSGCGECATCNTQTDQCEPKPAGTCCDDDSGVCAGVVCGGCDPGQRCKAGACVCDDQSCLGGCCDGDECLSGAANGACGRGGAACVACAGATPVCSAGVCVACGGFQQPCCPVGDPCAGSQCCTIEGVCGPQGSVCSRPGGIPGTCQANGQCA